MGNNYFKLEKNSLISNSFENKNTIMESDTICDNLIICADANVVQYSGIRISFCYGDQDSSLVLKRKIQRMVMSMKNGWRASRWVYDYKNNNRCSCILTRRETSEFNHKGTFIELGQIESYGKSDACEIYVELFDNSGKKLNSTVTLKYSKKFGCKILSFGPTYPELSSNEKPEIIFSAACSQSNVKINYELKRIIAQKNSSVFNSGKDYYKEKYSIKKLLEGTGLDKIKYSLIVKADNISSQSVECTVKIAPPEIIYLKTVPDKNKVKVRWDIEYSEFNCANGANMKSTPVVKDPIVWDLPQTNYRFNIFCTGYKRYISGTLFSTSESWVHIDYLHQQISYEHESGIWTMMLDWNIISFAKIDLYETSYDKTTSVSLTSKGKYILSRKGDLSNWTLNIKDKNNRIASIPLHTNMSEKVEIQAATEDKKAREKRLQIRYAKQFLYFLTTLKENNTNKSPWHRRHWQVFGDYWIELIGYDQFNYINAGCGKEMTLKEKNILKDTITEYQYYIILYLTYRKLLILMDRFQRDELDKTQYIEFFRLAGSDGASTVLYPHYEPLLCSEKNKGFSGINLFNNLSIRYKEKLGDI